MGAARRISVLITAVAAAGLASVALPSADAGASAGSHAAAPGVTYRYVVPTRNCGDAPVGQVSCFAVHLQPATASTPGAVRVPVHAQSAGGAGGSDPNGVVGPSPYGGYSPTGLAYAYGVSPKTGGNGITVGIVDAYNDPTVKQDLAAFDRQYGLPVETSSSFKVVNHAGNTSPLPKNNAGWAGEITLDVQTVRGMCHACKIVLIEGSNTGDLELARAVNTAVSLGATIVSNSYGGAEHPRTASEEAAYQAAYNHKGVAIVASTGDDGWYGWTDINQNFTSPSAPESPASLPTVVAVGGTALHVNDSDTGYGQEVAWNDTAPNDQYPGQSPYFNGASGGGCSTEYTAQSWQSSVSGWSNTGCGSKRLAADVSADADPNTGYDVYQTYGNTAPSPWIPVGGTSLAAPIISAIWALSGGAGGVSYPAQTLYGSYKYRSSVFHDVVPGSMNIDGVTREYDGTGFCGGASTDSCSTAAQFEFNSPNPNTGGAGVVDCEFATSGTGTRADDTQCTTATGYDGPTGVGTPQTVTGFKPLITFAASSSAAAVKLNHAFTVSASGFGDVATGGTFNRTTIDWGDGTTTIAYATSQRHAYHKAGTYTIHIAVVDSYGYMARHALVVKASA